MKNLPESIRIGPYTFTVDVDQKYIENHPKSQFENVVGLSEFEKQKVTLSESEGFDFRCDTLIHEILHLCFRVASLDVEQEVTRGKRENIEEWIVSSVSPLLLGVLRDNPDLLLYILQYESRRTDITI